MAASEDRPQKDSFIHLYVLTVLRDKPRTRSFCSQSLNCRFVWTDGHVRRQTCSTYDWQKATETLEILRSFIYPVDRSRETSVSIPLAFVSDRLRLHSTPLDSRLDPISTRPISSYECRPREERFILFQSVLEKVIFKEFFVFFFV